MQSPEAQVLRDTHLLIWDEAPTMHKHCFEAVDRLFRDLMRNNIPFGGKIFIIGGDFRQTLPVVLRGFRADIINATVKSSYLWRYVKQFQLTQNMRLNPEEIEYREYLLHLGNGTLPSEIIEDVPDFITLPENIWIPLSIPNLFNTIYDNFQNQFNEPDYLNNRAILAPLNKHTDLINDHATELIPGDYKIYMSHDSILDTENNNLFYSTEYLNSLDFSGIPPHKLKIKINQPVILLRNISNYKGLCNLKMHVLKKFHKKIFSLTAFIKSLAKTAQKRQSKYMYFLKLCYRRNMSSIFIKIFF